MKKPLFSKEQKAKLNEAKDVLLDVADTEFKRGMRKVAKFTTKLSKDGLRKP